MKSLPLLVLLLAPLSAFAGLVGPGPAVPVPGVLALMAIGGAGLLLVRRRR